MKKNVKNTLIITVLCLSMTNFGHAFDIDETVDDEIRKNYNPTQLINDVGKKESALEMKIDATKPHTSIDENLPALPSIINKTTDKKPADIKSNNTITTSTQNTTFKKHSMTIKSITSMIDLKNETIKVARYYFKNCSVRHFI